jgi:hypothetical protein
MLIRAECTCTLLQYKGKNGFTCFATYYKSLLQNVIKMGIWLYNKLSVNTKKLNKYKPSQ